MRITSHHIIEQQAAAAQHAEQNVSQLSSEASSGLRVTAPSQDVTSWLAAHRATLRDTLSKGVGTAMQYGGALLDQTDGALATISSIVTQVHQLAVQGANDTLNAANRADLATEVSGLLSTAIGAANTQAPDGEYLFGGSQSLAQPFDQAGAYHGDAAARAIPTAGVTGAGAATQVATIPGSGLTAQNGVDIFPLLQRVAAALAGNDVAGLQGTLTDLSTAQTQVASLRSRTGAAMAAVNSADDARKALELHLEATAANYVDADAVGVATQLAQASTALQTTQAVSAHVISILTQTSGT